MPSNHHSIELTDITKSFGAANVVDGVSFIVQPHEVFGLIGPNGAGKTTTIRMMMDIIKPDTGRISVLGQRLNEDAKNRIGYLPEERGLYRKLTVRQSLLYIGTLKGMTPERAAGRADELLARTSMTVHATKKVEELSRGMSQIIRSSSSSTSRSPTWTPSTPSSSRASSSSCGRRAPPSSSAPTA